MQVQESKIIPMKFLFFFPLLMAMGSCTAAHNYLPNFEEQAKGHPSSIFSPLHSPPACISGVINHYAAIVNICGRGSLTVDSITGFSPGDKIMIFQAQGALINTANGPAFGEVTSLENAGRFEFNYIQSIKGNQITLKFNLLHSYDLSGNPQIVNVPNFGDASICDLTCKPWDGKKGGILVFEGKHLTLTGNVNVSARGFRGGEVVPDPNYPPNSFWDYYGAKSAEGGMKGEGVSTSRNQFLWGKGSAANGGGGGNNINAGGGGGANGGKGGMGGTYHDQDILTQGLGGKALPYEGRLFFGGGGGAGHANNEGGTSGAAGGGIIYVLAERLSASSGASIMANGGAALLGAYDGSGGGGAGGTVVLDVAQVDTSIFIQCNGGIGGSNNSEPYPDDCHGTGGGGGGGVIYSRGAISYAEVSGGTPGVMTNTPTLSECTGKPVTSYATPGANGFIYKRIPLSQANSPYALPVVQREYSFCEGEELRIGMQVFPHAGLFTDTLFNEMGCDTLVSSMVKIIELEKGFMEFALCPGDTIHVKGEAFFSTGSFQFRVPGINGCDSLISVLIQPANAESCVQPPCKVYIPNIISPDEDGVNDEFEPFSPQAEFLDLKIFNRWGGLVFEGAGPHPKWDAKINNTPAPAGVYVFLLTGKCLKGEPIRISGDFTIIR